MTDGLDPVRDARVSFADNDSDEPVGVHEPLGHQAMRFADRRRRVVEAGHDPETLVVGPRDVERNMGAPRRAREEVDEPTLGHRLEGRLRGLHLSGRFDHHVEAPAARALLAEPEAQLVPVARVQGALGPELPGLAEPIRVAAHRHDSRPAQTREGHEHEADRPRPDDGDVLPGGDAAVRDPSDHAGQRLHHGRLPRAHPCGRLDHVLGHDAGRDA